ncbi:hypothetical protein [Phenylobacterium sp.]|uniref:hypothetical protein n=1 Tax=Phenylobacterium sp. TaxID=1871053 RepID=UPI00301C2146
MSELVTPTPPDAHLTGLAALQGDLTTAVDRAIAAGTAPADVITALGLVIGDVLNRMDGGPAPYQLGHMMVRVIATGQRVAEAKAAAAPVRVHGEATVRRP